MGGRRKGWREGKKGGEKESKKNLMIIFYFLINSLNENQWSLHIFIK